MTTKTKPVDLIAPEIKEITVMAHTCKAWPESCTVYLSECGRPIAMGRNAFAATCRRLLEEDLAKDWHKLKVNFVDGRPSVEGLIGDGMLV